MENKHIQNYFMNMNPKNMAQASIDMMEGQL
jgi:hypothetical protein